MVQILRKSLSVRLMVSMVAVMATVMTLVALYNLHQSRQQAVEELREKASVIAGQAVAMRAFIALNQERINSDSQGRYEFKHLNPAAVGKGVNEILRTSKEGYSFKQTRLQVRDADNRPDNFEIEGMKEFAAQPELRERWGFDSPGGVKVYRYMVPLYYEEACMPCHGRPAGTKDVTGHFREGFQPGEFAGAISVTLPLADFERHQQQDLVGQLLFVVVVLAVGMAAFHTLMEHIVVNPLQELTARVAAFGRGKSEGSWEPLQTYDEMTQLVQEFSRMADTLQQFHRSLENKVRQRTWLLEEANARLVEQGRDLLEMNRRLHESERLKSEFLAVMSHELRTPLTSIIAFTEILMGEGDNLTEQQREYLADVFESSHQLLNQINDILNMSRIEAGLVRLNARPMDIRETLDSVARVVAPLVRKKSQQFTIIVDGQIGTMVADDEKVKHILSNLIGNAVKFTPDGGRIAVRVRPAVLDDGAAAVRVDVQDTGVGIAPEEQGLIFNRFRQGRSLGQRENIGSGLGLAIVRNLVELQGGQIWVESMPDLGSTFTVILPLQPREEGNA